MSYPATLKRLIRPLAHFAILAVVLVTMSGCKVKVPYRSIGVAPSEIGRLPLLILRGLGANPSR